MPPSSLAASLLLVSALLAPGGDMTTEPEAGRRIVVGVDGSASSKAALAWAARQARLTGAAVEAIIAWEYPATYGYTMPAAPEINYNYEEIAAEVAASTIAEVCGQGEPVKISPRVVEGNAAQALLDASAGAELLVVGSRGHGGFVEALLGSVGQHCVHHATCPVVVVRGSVPGAA
jgi:nucleotide-binding universal stress UspA family protein